MRVFQDLSGSTFGKLRVIRRASDHITPGGKAIVCYLCECECGMKVVVDRLRLVSGRKTSCGCERNRKTKQMVDDLLSLPDSCFYFPDGVSCDNNHKCSKCGWNPTNTSLRKARIDKLLGKDGKDE